MAELRNSYQDLPVLVTGGAGFIGSHLVRGLLSAGARVRVLDNLSNGRLENLKEIAGSIEFLQGDITSYEACQSAVRDCRVVFHLAALGSVPRSIEEPLKYHTINIGGTLNMLEASRHAGVKRFVYSASSSAYGDTVELPKIEAMVPRPKSPYAIGKLVGEYNARVYAEVYGLSSVSLRYFNVFGPRQNPNSAYAAVIPAFLSALIQGKPPRIYGDGEQTRDFCFVANVVHANMLAGLHPAALQGPVVNVACGQRISLNAMLKAMEDLLAIAPARRIAPEYLPGRRGDVRDSLADITAAGAVLGYQPQVYFEQGLAQTVEWYKAFGEFQ